MQTFPQQNYCRRRREGRKGGKKRKWWWRKFPSQKENDRTLGDIRKLVESGRPGPFFFFFALIDTTAQISPCVKNPLNNYEVLATQYSQGSHIKLTRNIQRMLLPQFYLSIVPCDEDGRPSPNFSLRRERKSNGTFSCVLKRWGCPQLSSHEEPLKAETVLEQAT